MAKKIDKMKSEIVGEVLSITESENYMHKYDFVLIESEEDDMNNLVKFTNYKSQVWVECETDDENNILILNLKNIANINEGSTRKEPFRTYEDLEKVLNYFLDNKMYHHWFTSCLMVSLGRRVGDTILLKWSDLFLVNGEYRERLTTLKEEKTGKIVGVKLNALAKHYIEEYCKLVNIKPMGHYRERIFSNTSAAFRKQLCRAIKTVGITYPINTHSFRKYYANTIYKLHPQDTDNLMIVQTMMGHSDPKTTKIYINEIDKKSDKYIDNYAEHMLKKKNREEVEISNSPILSITWENARDLFGRCWDMARSEEDKFNVINKIIGLAEQYML